MNKKILNFVPCMLFLAACSDNAPKPQDQASPAQTAVTTQETVAQPEKQNNEVKLDLEKLLALLKKENVNGIEFNDVLDEIKERGDVVTGNTFSFLPMHCRFAYEGGAFKKDDGTYQVLLFCNSGQPTFRTDEMWSYIYDGEKLVANSIQLPKPKYSDLLDPVCYYKLDKSVVSKIKSASVSKWFHYRCADGQLVVTADLNDDLKLDEAYDFFGQAEAFYNWDGKGFVVDAKHPKLAIAHYQIGNLMLDEEYKGEAIDGYVVKPNGSSFECSRNGEKYFTINTTGGVIKSFDVFTDKLTANDEYFVGRNINSIDNMSDFKEIKKNGDTWMLTQTCGYMVVNAADVDNVVEKNGKIERVIFKDGAKVQAFGMKICGE